MRQQHAATPTLLALGSSVMSRRLLGFLHIGHCSFSLCLNALTKQPLHMQGQKDARARLARYPCHAVHAVRKTAAHRQK